LKSGVEKGTLLQVKASYKLSPITKDAIKKASKPKKVAPKKKTTAPKKAAQLQRQRLLKRKRSPWQPRRRALLPRRPQ
jgi:hypothetical protein